jgi:hypothetical protein
MMFRNLMMREKERRVGVYLEENFFFKKPSLFQLEVGPMNKTDKQNPRLFKLLFEPFRIHTMLPKTNISHLKKLILFAVLFSIGIQLFLYRDFSSIRYLSRGPEVSISPQSYTALDTFAQENSSAPDVNSSTSDCQPVTISSNVQRNVVCGQNIDECIQSNEPDTCSGTLVYSNDAPALGHIGYSLCNLWTSLTDPCSPPVKRVVFRHSACGSASGCDLEGPWLTAIKPMVEAMLDHVEDIGGIRPDVQFSDSDFSDRIECFQQVYSFDGAACVSQKYALSFRILAQTRFNLTRRVVGAEKPYHITIIRRTHNRLIKNLDELAEMIRMSWVGSVHLEIVDFGDRGSSAMSMRDQLEILANTDILLLSHGAAMSLIYALPINAVVIEMMPTGFYSYLYPRFAQQLGLQHMTLYPRNEGEGCGFQLDLFSGALDQERNRTCIGSNVDLALADFAPVIFDALMKVAFLVPEQGK